MEFRYRAIDSHSSRFAPPPRPPAPSLSYFAQQAQAFRAGYWRTNYASSGEFFGGPSCFREGIIREAIERELDKQRIREEIIVAEIARKRAMVAEFRREMMLEREWALRRGDVLPSSSSAGVPSLHHSEGSRLVEGRGALLLQEIEIGGLRSTSHETLPLRRNLECRISEMRPLSESAKEKEREKLVVLTKPEADSSGVKRKAVIAPAIGANELPLVASNKKAKGEWSCALFPVSATSEQGLNEHLKGKKHKMTEQGLRAQKTGKHFGIGLSPKNTSKPAKLVEISDNQGPKLEEKIEEKMVQDNKTGKMLLLDNVYEEQVEKNNELLVQLNEDANELKKQLQEPEQEMETIGRNKKKKFEFWCELCQVGTSSVKSMDSHEKGKKHVARLKQGDQNLGAVAGLSPKNTTKPAKLMGISENQGPKLEEKIEEKMVQDNKTGKMLLPDNVYEEQAEKNNELLVQLNKDANDLKKQLQEPEQEMETIGHNKKKKLEFWCELCQVGTFSVKSMDSHEKGKKHVARIKQGDQNLGAVAGLSPKNTSKPAKLVEISDNQGPKLEEKIEEKMVQDNKTGKMLLLDNVYEEQVEKNNKILVQLNKDANDLKKQLQEPEQEMETIGHNKKKKFEFWCELCQVGTFSVKSMDSHQKGKKHVARLKQGDQNLGAVAATRAANGLTAAAEEDSKG